MISPKADVLFEVSWEVCNKVGGIYTVVKSKADLINKAYKEYYLIGPYIKKKAKETFNEKKPPEIFSKIFGELSEIGIKCYFGEWLIKGKPKAILIDVAAYTHTINDYKKMYWDHYKIDSMNAGWTFEEPMLWSTVAGMIVARFSDNNKKSVIHCHEWMAGFALLYLKIKKCENVGTVFTTHATMLGRTICAVGRSLYEELDQLDPAKEAYHYNIQDKYLTELACTQNADVFTTVSEITSMEAEKILGRKADVLLLNGLDMEKFPSFEELSVKHRIYREKIREFISYYFFPYYHFDITQTLLFFIVGRYEFKNKGLDVFIKALGNLNRMMKKNNSNKTVIAFFWIPREVHGAKIELSENKINYYHIKDFVNDNQDNVQNKIISHMMESPDEEAESAEHFKPRDMFSEDFLMEARKLKLGFSKQGKPMICTHNLTNEQDDEIIRNLIAEGLDNKEDDKVKAIFYPVYLTGVDGLIDLPYYDALLGCHFGVFPSYYEPWGYTPLESAALGVTSLTTDLGGYGRFLASKKKGDEGVFVLRRFGMNPDSVIKEFSRLLYDYTLLHEKERVTQKILAKNIANLADWNEFVKFYFEAHNKAIEKGA
ncbi:MAG: glycogen/starch synthase [Candidatus Woesearchaeota archaeon]